MWLCECVTHLLNLQLNISIAIIKLFSSSLLVFQWSFCNAKPELMVIREQLCTHVDPMIILLNFFIFHYSYGKVLMISCQITLAANNCVASFHYMPISLSSVHPTVLRYHLYVTLRVQESGVYVNHINNKTRTGVTRPRHYLYS